MWHKLLFFSIPLFVSLSTLAQSDTYIIELTSKMYFISEIDHSIVLMDNEGNQFDHYDNFILVSKKGEKIKIPYNNNYIFWDEYDENMNITKKVYKIILKVSYVGKTKKNYQLLKVYDGSKLIYDNTKKNPFKP